MPDIIVWSTPKLFLLIGAVDAQAAASAFLKERASTVPMSNEPHACFVQATDGLEALRTDKTTVEFWRSRVQWRNLPSTN